MYDKIFKDELKSNIGQLAGTIASEPIFSHEVYGENFYELMLKVDRLSGQADILPVTFSERLVEDKNLLAIGNQFAVMGDYRSYNKIVDGKSKLILTFFAKTILDNSLIPGMNTNLLKLSGYICKPPVFRTTPFDREICDLLLAVNRAYNKSDYIPCIAWGRNARFSQGFSIGQKIEVEGRIQSRPYVKKIGEQQKQLTAYEVSIQKIEEIEDHRRSERFFTDALNSNSENSEVS